MLLLKLIILTLKKEEVTTTKALNTSAELSGFTVNNNATIKPAFSKDVKEYKIYVKDTIERILIRLNIIIVRKRPFLKLFFIT